MTRAVAIHAGLDCEHVVRIPHQSDLFARWLAADLFECGAAAEVVVELHHEPVADFGRPDIQVLEIATRETSADRSIALEGIGRQPFAERSRRLAGIDRRECRRDPPGFGRSHAEYPRADLPQPVLGPGSDDRIFDLVAVPGWSPDLEPGRARHSMVQRGDLAPSHLELAHLEEANIRERSAVHFLKDLLGIRTLHLVSEQPLLREIRRRPAEMRDFRIVLAAFEMEAQPVQHQRLAD